MQDTDLKFIELLGSIAQDQGSPRIAGEIMGYLTLSGDDCSLSEIAEALGVSKASVSTNVRLLETRGSAVRVNRRGSRQDHWRASDDPHSRILTRMSETFYRFARQIEDVAGEFPDDTEKRRKVEETAFFYRKSARFLAAWSEDFDQPAPATPAETE
ncbi:GbsR/MarR family transcriptional regulator [Pelagovum pacificum]|nr:MarR family transcriptional regulator [Pelagovum pacificum]QQA41711.1 MarR family transcriptional regulator [Pelagovum pacificum]